VVGVVVCVVVNLVFSGVGSVLWGVAGGGGGGHC
jgi:hypothetical protein